MCAGVNAADLIPVCAEGIRETVHPLSFMARQMFKELLAVPVCVRVFVRARARVYVRVCMYVCVMSDCCFD